MFLEGMDELPKEGHIWASMRKTAFILGSGLLLLVAFWNTVAWHLQRFWGTSGYFWQAQWERLLSRFEGKEWTLYIIGVIEVPSLVFWSFSGLLLVVDTTGKPNFISRYRIQVGKNEPVDTKKLRQCIRTVLFNQVVISLPMLVFLYPILKLRGDPCHRELPTFHWFLLELAIFTLIEEVLFYYSHRFSQCYGVLGVLDHLHGTDTMFKQTKAYERDILLLGFTPLSESIPDAPKKME